MKNIIEINTNWIERPEDFYITADIEYYDKYDEYWEDEDVAYDDVEDTISDRYEDAGLKVERIVYYINDMCAGSDEAPELVADYGETEYVAKTLEMLKMAKGGK
jgi:hypothetical protein